jgi:hypothetical protein
MQIMLSQHDLPSQQVVRGARLLQPEREREANLCASSDGSVRLLALHMDPPIRICAKRTSLKGQC